MLYNIEYALSNAKERIKSLDEKENVELILKFLDKLFADGLSKARVVKYANHLKTISERMKKSFMDVDTNDMTAFLSELEQSEYAPQTKRDYKIVLKKFFRYLGKGELVKDVKQTLKANKKKLPGEILTEHEVRRMIEAADHPRNKALIGILYEGGLRIGELASLRIKSVEFNEYGATIRVSGKTGERRVLIVSTASLLTQWLEMHPRRDDKEASLWVNLSPNYKKEGITYQGIAQNLKRIAKKAGVEKRINPHIFRHSRATHLAKDLTEAQMNVYFGWVQGSNMPATYVHLSGRDVDEAILQLHGLKSKDKDRENVMRPIECPRCQYINAPVSRYCGRCGLILNEGERVRLEIESKQFAKDFTDLASGDPRLLEGMKKAMELVELFEKNPELFNTVRSMIKKESM